MYCLNNLECLLCGHKVQTLNLPKKLPKKILLKCSKCNREQRRVVATYENIQFSFNECGISKEEFINALQNHELYDEEDDIENGLEGIHYGGEDDNYVEHLYRDDEIDIGQTGSMSSLEWNEDEEEWTSF